MDDDRPRSVPEIRGMSVRPEVRERERVRERPYTAESYAAQYGITVEDAAEIRSRYVSHRDMSAAITRLLASDESLRRRALFLDADVELSPDEEERYARILSRGLPTKVMESV